MTDTTLGILAHVDAGKTTLAEAMLYTSGAIRKAGRVDAGDTALDTHDLEKRRGITIFTGQARFSSGERTYTLLDTPGHVDFSSATENALCAMDYAVLVINGTQGAQAHTSTLWRLLEIYNVPVFLFVTKMDYSPLTEEDILAGLRKSFGRRVIPLASPTAEDTEEMAAADEDVLERYLETGTLPDKDVRKLIAGRSVFPVYFGSGLKMSGVTEFIAALDRYTRPKEYPAAPGARVFKVTFDDKGTRITHVKITGGAYSVRDTVKYADSEEKIAAIRLYSGQKFTVTDTVRAGDVCAFTGLGALCPGDGIGRERDIVPILEPVMTYSLILPENCPPETALPKLKELEAEDPALRVTRVPGLNEIRVSLNGKVQAEILTSIIRERFGIEVRMGSGSVLYKETVENTVEGVGHYEPLRHYAEVHLLIEPAARGSGITAVSKAGENDLDRNWQRLILTHITEKQHLGVLTGAPLTDVKITLASGKAHLKHTEGGDFRQATYRAVRQGLMQAKSRLLEPWYAFTLEIPCENTGRAITDIRQMSGEFTAPETQDDFTVIRGRLPAATCGEYSQDVAAYTSGRGRFICFYDGYDLCHNESEVIEKTAYRPESDLNNTPDSVFCAHGAGFTVSWRDVKNYMHLPGALEKKTSVPGAGHRNFRIDDRELEEIMRREFGSVKYEIYRPKNKKPDRPPDDVELIKRKQYVIVDGYNCIFAWNDLKELADFSLEKARERLLDILCNYAAYTKCDLIAVFDGYKVAGNRGEKTDHKNIHVVYTKERETADAYIEKFIADTGGNDSVRVVTSDGLIQLTAIRLGVRRESAREFEAEVDDVCAEIERVIRDNNKGDGFSSGI